MIFQNLSSHPHRVKIEQTSTTSAIHSDGVTLTLTILDQDLKSKNYNWPLLDPATILVENNLIDPRSLAPIKSITFSLPTTKGPLAIPAVTSSSSTFPPSSLPFISGKDPKLKIATSLAEESSSQAVLTFQISGMTCASCSSSIETNLSKVNGVKSVQVNLLSEMAVVTLEKESTLDAKQIISEIEDYGFGAEFISQAIMTSPRQSRPKSTSHQEGEVIVLSIEGMTCASCVSSIEEGLKKIKGIKSVSVSLLANRGDIVIDPTTLRVSDLLEHVEDLGFQATLLSRR